MGRLVSENKCFWLFRSGWVEIDGWLGAVGFWLLAFWQLAIGSWLWDVALFLYSLFFCPKPAKP